MIDFGLGDAMKFLKCTFTDSDFFPMHWHMVTAMSRHHLASAATVLGAEDDRHPNKQTSCACDDDSEW